MTINNISFKSIYRVQSSTNPVDDKRTVRPDLSTMNVVLALTPNRESIYSKKEVKAIQNLFKTGIPDYQKSSRVKAARANGDLFMLTGKDKDSYEKFDKEKLAKLNKIGKNYHLSQAEKEAETQKVYDEMNSYFDSKEIQPKTIHLISSAALTSPVTLFTKCKMNRIEIRDDQNEEANLSLNLNEI
ncbi:hypothetical protein II906_03640 [bacterium]|nr:hypothetical protein [bacterium]